jgi:hypothetical protein
MSRADVGIVIDRLLTDDDLRIRFALDRFETVAELCLLGADLTRDEIETLCQTDAHLWFVGDKARAEWQQWTGTRGVVSPESAAHDPTRSEEAKVARVIDEILTVLERRDARRLKE